MPRSVMLCLSPDAIESAITPYEGKRVLVTGAAGFIGKRLIDALAQIPCEIVALSRQEMTFLDGAKARLIPVHGRHYEEDALDMAFEKRVDTVFHLGAQTSADTARKMPLADIEQNVVGSLKLFERARSVSGPIPAIVFASTATIVGLADCLPIDETVPADPLTLYDIDKQTTEQHLRFYVGQQLFTGASLRLSNVYGPGSSRGGAADRGILNKVIKQALDRKSITVFGDGQYIRDFVFIDDVIHAFLLAGLTDSVLDGRHFVVGSGEGVTIRRAFELVAERVFSRLRQAVTVAFTEMPAHVSAIEKRNYVANSRAFSELTGWEATCSLSDGIDRTIEYLIENRIS